MPPAFKPVQWTHLMLLQHKPACSMDLQCNLELMYMGVHGRLCKPPNLKEAVHFLHVDSLQRCFLACFISFLPFRSGFVWKWETLDANREKRHHHLSSSFIMFPLLFLLKWLCSTFFIVFSMFSSVDPHRSPSAPFSAQLRRPAVHRRRPAPPQSHASHRRIGGPVDGIG